ncbi:hypothetical protein KC640_00215 [Candidatus Dojkabacteria bacterium]|uniref:Uncharacterized protein n=1 Tax=Candidatus Dojkabacteria bacterium TaxID=2099670 RepID=A0A955KZ39_9BACT|nr:hypothetical protein [Candidatus Dojkabacteria bacterium]
MFRQKRTHKKLPAFTLVEGILYTALLGAIAGIMVGTVVLIFRYKIAVEDRVSVNEDLRILIKSIRDDMYFGVAESVNGSGNIEIEEVDGSIITYYLQGNQVYRQAGVSAPLAITSNTNNVSVFEVIDWSSASAAGTIKVTVTIGNYPAGTLKPAITENITTALSLRFI